MTEQTQTQTTIIPDDEIRDWAKQTGREAGQRGRVPASLRREYEQLAAAMAGPPEAPPGPALAGGSESHAETPEPARAETRPRKVPQKRRGGVAARLQAFLGVAPPPKSGSRAKAAPKAAPGPRQAITDVVASGWDRFGRWVAKVNPPVGRALSWQADYAGMVAEEVLPDTPVDRALQFAVRARGKYAAAGAVIATPIIVYLLEQPSNQPVDPDTGRPSPAGMAKHELLMEGLEDCLRLQLKYLGGEGRAEKLAKQQADRAEQQAEVDRIIGLFFEEPPQPGSPEAAAQAQADAAAAAQAQAAQAVRFMAPAPAAFTAAPPDGIPIIRDGVQIGVASPDLRGARPPLPPAGPRSAKMRVRDDGRLEPDPG